MNHIKKMHLNIRRTPIGHAKVKAGKRRKCMETLEIKKNKCNICLCGGAKIFKRTNRETLDWLKLNSGLSQTELLIEVQGYFGTFSGQKQKINTWKKKFEAENKSQKQKAHRNLMKECGGSGKHGEIPPVNYVTEWFELGEQCPMCKISFKDSADLKEHARSYHGDYIKKWWSKSAIEHIHEYKDYNDWLDKETNMENDETHNKNEILEELKKTNEILIEKNKELAENNDTFVKVAERGNIIETRRSILKQRDDGTFSKSVVVEQFANVTKRKTYVDKETQI